MILSTICSIVLLGNAILASPAPQCIRPRSTLDILTSVFGPLNKWNATRLIDVDPQAIVEGKPVTSDIILYWHPPPSASEAQFKQAEALLENGRLPKAIGLDKRATERCYRSGRYVLQDHLRHGAFWTSNSFCARANSMNPDFPVYEAQTHYVATDGSWHPYRDVAFNRLTTVVFQLSLNRRSRSSPFIFADCVFAIEQLLRDCHGGNPNLDSQGGYLFDDWTDILLDPSESL